MLIVGHPGLTPAEAESHFFSWAISAAPLGLSLDLAGIDAATLALLSAPEVLAVDQDAAGIQGVRATPPNATGSECWSKPLSAGAGNSSAVLLFNRADAVGDVTCAWADVAPHLPPDAILAVRDLFRREALGNFAARFTATALPPHGSMLISITPL